jgi:SPP1 gp7 family putative phage head morphogenesis protein
MLENKKTRHIEVEINKMELLDLKKAGIKQVKIYTCNDDHVCGQCKKLSGKVFEIDKALKEMPIPNNCENDKCRCWYVAHFD